MLRGRACFVAVVGLLTLGGAAQNHVVPGAAERVRVVQELLVTVPELSADTTFETAPGILRAAGLQPGNTLCDPASAQPGAVTGRVTAFRPISGTRVPPGSRVDMVTILSVRCGRPDPAAGGILFPRGRVPIIRPLPDVRPVPPAPPPPPPPPPEPTSAGPDGPSGNGHAAEPPRPPAAANGGAAHTAPRITIDASGRPNLPRMTAPDSPATDTVPDEPLTQPATDTAPDQLPAGAQPGLGAFVEPGDMAVEAWHRVEFVVGRDAAALAEESEDQALSASRDIFVAPIMRVTLLPDENFEIKPQSPAVQRTGLDKAASWQWSVRPLRGGTWSLIARVEVLESAQATEAVETYTKRVSVRVRVGTWKGFLNALREAAGLGDLLATLFRSWEKTLLALTALIAAAVGLWAAIRKLRTRETRGRRRGRS